MHHVSTSEAVALLHSGEVVIFATETVMALAADAKNQDAVSKIYDLKGRDAHKPLSLLLHDYHQIAGDVKLTPNAERICSTFMPGALTIVVAIQEESQWLRALNNANVTVGFRVPDHPLAQAVLRAFAAPIVATSVNLSGEDAATDDRQASLYFPHIPIIANEEEGSASGVASTVVDMTSDQPVILRAGSISQQDIDHSLKRL